MDYKLGLLIKLIHINFERILTNGVADIDLTASQCDVLRYISNSDKEEINPIDIEKKCSLKKPTVSGILKRLEEKEFIKIEQSSKDNRYKKIVLTEKAKKHKATVHKKMEEVEKIMLKGVSDDEQKEVERILKIIFNNLKDTNIN